MTDLLALDPSIDSSGVALFRDGLLIAAARITPRLVAPWGASNMPHVTTHGERALAMADAVIGWILQQQARISVLAHEWPQVYPHSKANPNNLIGMAAVDGAVACALSCIATQRKEQLELRVFLPAEWAGQLPKDTHTHAEGCALRKRARPKGAVCTCDGAYWKSPRGQRIASRLTVDELAVAPDQHDAGDAIGVGLHALGRLGVRRALASR